MRFELSETEAQAVNAAMPPGFVIALQDDDGSWFVDILDEPEGVYPDNWLSALLAATSRASLEEFTDQAPPKPEEQDDTEALKEEIRALHVKCHELLSRILVLEDGASQVSAEAEVVEYVNEATLRDMTQASIPKRARDSIVAHRPFRTQGEIAELAGVGQRSFEKIVEAALREVDDD